MNTIIDRKHLEQWADLPEAKLLLPKLVARLIQATTPSGTRIDLPSGSAINLGGYDGLVTCTQETSYMPAGQTVLELSAEAKAKAKVSRDQKKRSTKPISVNPRETTLIHVTLRYLSDEGRQELIQEGRKTWKDVQVYGSVQLAQWIPQVPAVMRWFAGQVLNMSEDGWRGAEEFWQEWAASAHGTIPPELVYAGREKEAAQLRNFLAGEPGVKFIRATTMREALAFITATAILSEEDFRELFMARTLIIETEQTFRTIRDNSMHPANFIALFNDRSPIRSAVLKRHHVLIPIGADEDSANTDVIELPVIDRDGQIDALESMGLDREKAERFSREAGRSISILRKLLKASDARVKWAQYPNKREIIPALLLGRWDESYQSDRDLVAKIAGMPYDSYTSLLANWQNYEAPPIIKIGSKWRLTSALDTWIECAALVTKTDLDQLRLICIEALSYPNAKYVPDPNRVHFFSEPYRNKYSGLVLEGMLKTLVLIACYGDKLRATGDIGGQMWVDEVVMRIFDCADGDQWCFLNYRLPLIAEAAPAPFLHALHSALTSPEQYLTKMFEKREQRWVVQSSDSNYYGLLWALEGLAWLPSHFDLTCSSLLQLSKYTDAEANQNYSMDSLQRIFCPFYPQTQCPAAKRDETIARLDSDAPNLTFPLLMSILPKDRETTYRTNRLYLRLFEEDQLLHIDPAEMATSHANAVSLLLKRNTFTDQQFCTIITASINLPPNLQFHVLTRLEEIIPEMSSAESEATKTLRGIINQHRSYPEQNWALPSTTIDIYERILSKLQAPEITLQHKWLFDTVWLEFPDAELANLSLEEMEEKQSLRSRTVRLNALEEIMAVHGRAKIFQYSFVVDAPEVLGRTYAEIFRGNEDAFEVTEMMDADLLNPEFAYGFFSSIFHKRGSDYIMDLVTGTNFNIFSVKTRAQILTAISPTVKAWKLIDSFDDGLREAYWQNVKVWGLFCESGEEDEGLGYLIRYKRYASAVGVAGYPKGRFSTQSLLSLLNGLIENGQEQIPTIRAHSLLEILRQLEQAHNVERDELIRLEWIYYPLLHRLRTSEPELLLFEELRNNPEFFISLIELSYPTETDALKRKEERQSLTSSELALARQATIVLKEWKTIPGTDADDKIDFSALKNWIDSARELAKHKDRLKYADVVIGQIFSRFPEKDENWPLLELFKLLESYNSKKMLENFNVGLFNKRGVSIRGAFSGGGIERNYAAYFTDLWQKFSGSCPNVAGEFLNLANSFLISAKRQDDDAALEELDA